MFNLFEFIKAVVFIHIAFGSFLASACSIMALPFDQQNLVAHSYDIPAAFPVRDAYLVVHPRGIMRCAECVSRGEPLRWTAKYGSVTIHLPCGEYPMPTPAVPYGVNEKGVTAALLWLKGATFSKETIKPILTVNRWAQYFLDEAESVDEAIQLAASFEVGPLCYGDCELPFHLFLHDALGNTAVMEYLEGRLLVYQGKKLPLPILTNSPYACAIESLSGYLPWGGECPLPSGESSEARFLKAASFIKDPLPLTDSDQAVAYAFGFLGAIAKPPHLPLPTLWSSVFDASHALLYFRDLYNQQLRYLSLKEIDFTAGRPESIQKLNGAGSGEVTRHFCPIASYPYPRQTSERAY